MNLSLMTWIAFSVRLIFSNTYVVEIQTPV